MKRVNSIDITRGLVMMVMALDHVRDLLHTDSIIQSPTNLLTTSPLLFFTRWVTYLCAPVFVFLAGTSAYMSLKNKGDISQSRKFLLKRGLWLILLEFTIVSLGLFLDVGFHTLLFEVIAAIGFGFVMLSLLIKLPAKALGTIGLLIIFCHNLFPLIPFADRSVLKAILSPFFSPAAFPVSSYGVFVMGYPPVPWLGIMLTGFSAGKLFELPDAARKRLFIRIGFGALLFFVLLRYLNFYGDPAQWSVQKSGVLTFLSFMNITKYPPSLLFCLVTLGIMFLVLALTQRANRFTNIASVYGKVPLFYFLLHFYIIHAILIAVLFMQGFHWADLSFASGTFGRPKGVQSGLPLWAVYIIWISVVALLYKPCLWYGKYKKEHTQWWLRYV